MRSPANAAPLTIAAAADWGARQLAKKAPVDNAHRVDARALLIACFPFDDYAALLAMGREAMPAQALERYREMITTRADGYPVAYILGWREFYGRRFKTTPDALIPRPDTETLVDAALAYLPAGAGGRALDLGTGCGAIGISIALHRPLCMVTMTDVNEETLALARHNQTAHKAENTRLARGDWYAPLAGEQPFDVIVSNPPYIASDDEHLRRGDARFEPPLALVGGETGLAALTRVIGNAPDMLRRGGALLVEHGYDQAAAVRELFAGAGFCGQRALADIAGLPRVTVGVLP